MDLQLQSSQAVAGQYTTWDYNVVNGIVPILADAGAPNSLEDQQHATTAAFIQTGTVPQLPNFGVDWMGYFLGNITIGVVDGQIKSNLVAVGLPTFYPAYDIVNFQLKVSVVHS